MKLPSISDVYRAKKTIAPHIPRTPLHFSAGLSELLDAQVYLKHDEHLPLGAFKARGGINLLANLSQEERGRGVITASTGNHGQSSASACRLFGARAPHRLARGGQSPESRRHEGIGRGTGLPR